MKPNWLAIVIAYFVMRDENYLGALEMLLPRKRGRRSNRDVAMTPRSGFNFVTNHILRMVIRH
jgi:hypothetical protein